MNLKFLGGAREVGRSGVLLDTGTEKILMDYGIKIVSQAEGPLQEPKIPLKVNLNLDGLLLSHAHLDHSGFVPNLYHRGYRGPTYSTATTFDLSRILLKDSIKLANLRNQEKHFFSKDLKIMEENEYRVTYGQYFYIGRVGIGVYDAGHIPGSVTFHLDTGKKTIVYSGDIKLKDTELLKGLEPIRERTDVLMMESTYGEREHPDREKQERELVGDIKATLENNGVALLPSFAVGRAQEILLILEKFGLINKYPVYLDGMSIDATKVILRYPELIRNPQALEKIFKTITKVHNNRQRDKIINEPSIVVTTSGMLNGGPIVHYLEKLYQNEKCSLILTGFQVPGSAGRTLLDTGKYITETDNFKVKCKIRFIDLSAHAGRNELFKYVRMIDPEKILVMHGDECEKFAGELREMGYDAYAPSIGEVVEI
ncbi:MAG: MBL fold metallo-hydrolase [Candidatus Aenigmarchaeota archaeon]|nr:MBL fold metallo-hydrolase [Candidatus Aenigmarchaeota archaeon]